MWLEILCGLVFFRLFRRFFYEDNEEVLQIESSDFSAIFSVASRLEKIYGGKAFVGLRIPDPDTGSLQSIDLVLVSQSAVMVVSVRNLTGVVDLEKDGSWVCIGTKLHKERHPDPVEESKRQVAVLERYLEQRGVFLPEGYMIGRVVLPNPSCRATSSIGNMPEVISFDRWTDLKPELKSGKPESRSGFSNWFKDALRGGKKDTQEETHQKIHFILNTAPMWDRLELKGDRTLLGEFKDFKGRSEDILALTNVTRSKVSSLIIQKSSLFGGFGRSKMQVLYAARDYRSEGASGSYWNEATVKSSMEVIFHPLNSKKPRKIKLSSIVSVTLSA